MNNIPQYKSSQFKRSKTAVYEHVDDDRIEGYIAFPSYTSEFDEIACLWWAKSVSEPEMWSYESREYRLYAVYAKTMYLDHLIKEVAATGGVWMTRTVTTIKVWRADGGTSVMDFQKRFGDITKSDVESRLYCEVFGWEQVGGLDFHSHTQ